LRTLDQGIARLGPIVGLELAAAALEDKLGSGSDAEVRRDRVAEQIRRARVAGVVADVWPRPVASSSPPMLAIPAVDLWSRADRISRSGPQTTSRSGGAPTVATTSHVLYGTALSSLTQSVEDATPTTEHEITLIGLDPDTRYYYAVGSTTSVLEGGDAQHAFMTAPNPGTPLDLRGAVEADTWVEFDVTPAITGEGTYAGLRVEAGIYVVRLETAGVSTRRRVALVR
jgi:hypothetical protein